jgi:hypothetical protein
MSYVMREDESPYKAYFRLNKNNLFKIILVVDSSERLIGLLTLGDFQNIAAQSIDLEHETVGNICNRKFSSLRDDQNIYLSGRNIFAERKMDVLPVIDEFGIPKRLFARWQAFFRDYYDCRNLNYLHYAYSILTAARNARLFGYDKISVIEFGVAGGNGLLHCELYAREIKKLTGVDIDVYGFDSGVGLFKPRDFRDMPLEWIEGDCRGDLVKLQNRLEDARLVLGDICETAKTFFQKHQPAPVAVMLIDVDQYTPTVAILDMLLAEDDYFLPVIQLYFDDIHPYNEFQGESLAVKEFNSKSESVKISPEGPNYDNFLQSVSQSDVYTWARFVKQCHRFAHKKYTNTYIMEPRDIPLVE